MKKKEDCAIRNDKALTNIILENLYRVLHNMSKLWTFEQSIHFKQAAKFLTALTQIVITFVLF